MQHRAVWIDTVLKATYPGPLSQWGERIQKLLVASLSATGLLKSEDFGIMLLSRIHWNTSTYQIVETIYVDLEEEKSETLLQEMFRQASFWAEQNDKK